jgi:3-hydroxyisobutyrate dehydrogenase
MSSTTTSLVCSKKEKDMKIGFIGTGLMGQPMAVKLLEAGLSVIAYNRTGSKLQPIQEAGATVADSPKTVLEEADCIILMLTDAQAIKEMLLAENTLSLLKNRTIIQMGTISPQESKSICDKVIAAGGTYLEAPVLGSIPEVKTGELIVMVGSTEAQFQQWLPILKHYSPEPMHIGAVGTASAMKLALNQLIAGLTATFALTVAFVKCQGVDVEQFMQVVRASALYAPTFDKKLARMLEGNFANPNFPTKHLLKDTNLFLHQAKELGLETDNLEGIKTILEKALEMGLADTDYSAIYQAINPN